MFGLRQFYIKRRWRVNMMKFQYFTTEANKKLLKEDYENKRPPEGDLRHNAWMGRA